MGDGEGAQRGSAVPGGGAGRVRPNLTSRDTGARLRSSTTRRSAMGRATDHELSTMRPCVRTEILRSYLADQLGEPEASATAAHLAECSHCQDELDTLADDPDLPAWADRCGPLPPRWIAET